jgi:hypothetical protein
MAVLKQGVALTQDDPLLKVDNRLEAGRHRFQLEVVDEAGLVSEPAVLIVSVSAPAPPPGPTPTPGRLTIDPRILTRATTATTRTIISPTIRRIPTR